jgi:hypothetical protein
LGGAWGPGRAGGRRSLVAAPAARPPLRPFLCSRRSAAGCSLRRSFVAAPAAPRRLDGAVPLRPALAAGRSLRVVTRRQPRSRARRCGHTFFARLRRRANHCARSLAGAAARREDAPAAAGAHFQSALDADCSLRWVERAGSIPAHLISPRWVRAVPRERCRRAPSA